VAGSRKTQGQECLQASCLFYLYKRDCRYSRLLPASPARLAEAVSCAEVATEGQAGEAGKAGAWT